MMENKLDQRPEYMEAQVKVYRHLFLTGSGGLIAISVVILQAFISVGKLDISEFISVLALAIAIPLLAGIILAASASYIHEESRFDRMINFFVTGSLSAIVGIAAALFHVSWIACVLFVVSTIVAAIAFSMFF